MKKGVATSVSFMLRADVNAAADQCFPELTSSPGQVNGSVPSTDASANWSVYVSKDGAAPAAAVNTLTAVNVTTCPGLYTLALTAGEMDADLVIVYAKYNTAGAPYWNMWPVPLIIYTSPNWDEDLFGDGFSAADSSLAGLRLAVTNAQTPITRDD